MSKRMGRPCKDINKTQFENLCAIQATLEEICGVFEISDKTLNRWCKQVYGTTFSEVFKEKRQLGKISLRRAQFELAKKNTTMAIWLGKQWLGQKDTNAIELSGVDGNPIKTENTVQIYLPNNGRD